MSSIPLIAIGSVVLFFGFFGYVVPVGEFGSVIDLSTLCNSLVGQVGRVFNEEALVSCLFVNTMAKLVYGLLGIGFILVIVGAIVNPTKKSMYICGYCNTSYTTEQELQHHKHKLMCEYCLIKFASAEEFKNHIISNHTKNYNIDNVDSDKINSEKIKPQIKASKPRNLKQSPTFKGILIGILIDIGLVIILFSFPFLYFSIVSENVFVMANDGMEPAIKKYQLMHYTKIPFADLQKNDIIVYVDPAGQVSAKVSRVIDVIEDDPEAVLVKSDNSQSFPFKLIENIYIGKVTEISDGLDLVLFRKSILLLFIPAFVIPIVVMKLKNRKMKADQ